MLYMKQRVVFGDFCFHWNGSFYEMSERDPVKRVFLDMRHRLSLLEIKRYLIDI